MSLIKRFRSFFLENKTQNQIIAKNAAWLFGGQLISRLLRVSIVVYAARVLGVESWGAFSYALGVAAFLTIFSDLGINGLITRETTRHPELKSAYLSTAFFTKLGLLSILILGVIFFFPYLTNIEEAAAIMPILIFVFAFDTLRELGSALSRALEKMEIEAGVQVFTNLAIVVFGFIFLTNNPTSSALASAYALGSAIGFMAIAYVLRAHLKNFFQSFRKDLIKPILQLAWPFGLMGLMGGITLNTDIIMLGWMREAVDVGYYAAAQKPVQLLYIIPTLVASSIFPLMARLAKRNKEKARELLESYGAVLIFAAILIVIGGVLLAEPIITILFGNDYLPALLTFRILLFTVLMVYPTIILSNAIFAHDEQRHFISFVFVAVFGNVFFNLLLIPSFGIEGAAVSTILTQFITNSLIWMRIKKINGFSLFSLIKNLPAHLVQATKRAVI